MIPLSERTVGALDGRVPVPEYDRSKVTAGVVHLGVGGFHRAHQAAYHDRLMNERGPLRWGICGVGVLERDRGTIEALAAQDGLYTLLVKAADGLVAPRVIGSIVELLLAPDDPEAVLEKLAAPATRLVTLTITEGGYLVDDTTGEFDAQQPDVARDLARDPAAPPSTAFGYVVEGLRRRRERGVGPFTVLSCDNLQGNGEIARTAFGTFAHHRDPELGAWIAKSVPFPSSVVDRITPATTDADRATAAEMLGGVEDRAPVVCEPFTQWVIDAGAAGELPPYGDVGARMVDDVLPHELMKLRLLNAGHQAVAYFGRLCGHTYVHEAAQDPDLRAFLAAYLDREAVPTIRDVPPDELAAFRAAVPERFANPAIGDTLERLATDASDRIPKFLLPVIRERLSTGGDVSRAAAIVAALTVYCADHPLADRRADELATRARDSDPLAFLHSRAVFGDLAEDDAFTRPYRAALESLDASGPRATLASLA